MAHTSLQVRWPVLEETRWRFRYRRERLGLSQVFVALQTGLNNVSLCGYELGYIPYYGSQRILDKFYSEREILEIEMRIKQGRSTARQVIIDHLEARKNQHVSSERLEGSFDYQQMRVLLELHPEDFFRIYDRHRSEV
jgi:hypothetical protein